MPRPLAAPPRSCARRRSPAPARAAPPRPPGPSADDSTIGVAFAARFRRATCSLSVCRVERVGLGQRDDLRLVGEPVAVGLELAADRACRPRPASSPVPSTRWSSTRQRSTWPRKRSPSPAPSCAPSIRPGMSASTNSPLVDAHDAEARVQRRERIVGDLRLRRAMTAARKVDLPALGRPTRPASAISFSRSQIQRSSPGQAGIGAARRPVGRGLEVGVAEAAVAALGEQHALADLRSGRRAGLVVLGEDLGADRHLQDARRRRSRRCGSGPCRGRRSWP